MLRDNNSALGLDEDLLIADTLEKAVLPLRKLDRDDLDISLQFLKSGLDTFDNANDRSPVTADDDLTIHRLPGEVEFLAFSSSFKVGLASQDEVDKILGDVTNALSGFCRLGSHDSEDVITSLFSVGSRATEGDGDRGLLLFAVRSGSDRTSDRLRRAVQVAVTVRLQSIPAGNIDADTSLVTDLLEICAYEFIRKEGES